MKYILLFEAFKSELLTGVFGHLSNSAKKDFKDELVRLSEKLDFPMSELSDDLFQYVPNVGDKAKDIGTEDDRKDDTIFKFWFDVKGNFITKSVVRENKGLNKDGYKVVKTYGSIEVIKDAAESGEINSGDKFWINLENGHVLATALIERLWKENGELKSTNIFMIQDSNDGNPPDSPGYVASYSNTSIESEETESDGTVTFNFTNGVTFNTYPDWKSWGKYSWMLAHRNDFRGVAEKLEKDKSLVLKKKANFIFDKYWNVGVKSFDEEIKVANFAIVLDYEKMKSKDYKKRGETRKERSELKSGIISKERYEEIKSININRYLKELSKSIKVDSDLKNLDTIFWKLFRKKLLLTDVLFELDSISEFDRTITRIAHFLSEKEYDKKMSEERTQFLLGGISDPIKRTYESGTNRAVEFSDSENSIRNYLRVESEYPEIKEKVLELVNKYLKLVDDFAEKISTLPKETIEDYEIILLKFKSIYVLFNRQTYGDFRTLMKNILDWQKKFYNNYNIVYNVRNQFGNNEQERIDKYLESITRGVEQLDKFAKQIVKLL
jgi:hypothetical protein